MNKDQRNRLGKYATFLLIVFFLVAFSVTLFFFTPEEIVEALGVHNTYLVVFIIATIGGLSTLTGTSMFVTIATFASGGSDPWLLGLIGGLGIFISDTIFFFLALKGTEVFEKRSGGMRDKLSKWIYKSPKWLIRLIVFVYTGITPLPTDVLMISLAVTRVPYKVLAPSVFLGSICIATITAHIGYLFFDL